MGKSNTELIKIALGHLGDGGAKFRRFAGLPSGAAWCNAFVDYIANEAGDARLYFNGKKETYCPSSIKWCQKNLAELPPYLALPADIIYFDWELNGRPNHVGLVRARKSTGSIYTVEGNTSGGKVAKKTRSTKYVQGIFRPLFVPAKVGNAKLKIDGHIGYYSIYNLQRAMGMKPTGTFTKETVKILQKKAGANQDGVWGPGTSRKVQQMIGASQDGDFGPASAKKLQQWVNRVNYPPATKKPAAKPAAKPAPVKKPAAKVTNAQKIINKANELAWPYGTPAKKYSYKTGAPTAKCKAAMKKYGWADNRAELSDCGNFVSTVVRESGVNKKFKALHGVKTPFPKSEDGFKLVLSGKKIPDGFLKPGDIIRYKKTNGKQHAMLYYGPGKVCEASHKNIFGTIRKDTKRYNTQSKPKTLQVFRAK